MKLKLFSLGNLAFVVTAILFSLKLAQPGYGKFKYFSSIKREITITQDMIASSVKKETIKLKDKCEDPRYAEIVRSLGNVCKKGKDDTKVHNSSGKRYENDRI